MASLAQRACVERPNELYCTQNHSVVVQEVLNRDFSRSQTKGAKSDHDEADSPNVYCLPLLYGNQ